jgi:hypothetical protein
MHGYSSPIKNMLDPLALFAPKPKAPDVPAAPAVPTAGSTDAQLAARNASLEAQAAGRGSTILTSGIGDTSSATVDKKQLLG